MLNQTKHVLREFETQICNLMEPFEWKNTA